MIEELRKDDPPTAVEMWRRRCTQSPDRLAFRHKDGTHWATTTWSQADAAAREIAAGVAGLGVQAGHNVAILAQTRLEWVLCDVAVQMAGAATVPIYPSSTPEQCAFILEHAQVRLAFVENAAQLEKLLLQRREGAGLASSGLVRIVAMDGDAQLERPDAKGRTRVAMSDVLRSAPPGLVIKLSELRAEGRRRLAEDPTDLDRRAAAVGPTSPSCIMYTSGTTGVPKGVVLTHETLVASVRSATRAMKLYETDEQLLFLPLAHVLGRELEWAPVDANCPTAFAESIGKVKDNLTEVRPTFMVGAPRVFEKFFAAVQAGARQGSAAKRALIRWAFKVGREAAKARREGRKPGALLALRHRLAESLVLSKLRSRLGLDRCRFLISGGAALAAEIPEFFDGVGLTILEGYGLTETMAACFLNRLEKYRFGTVGQALDIVECRLAEDGEILLRGPSIFREYYRAPAETAEAIDSEGWFHTGDIGVLEDEGFLRITDRKKDLIVTAGGKNVAPQPLENALKARCPDLAQVLVCGDRRPYVVALVTVSDEAVARRGGDRAKVAGSKELRQEIQHQLDSLNAGLASFETIKRFAVLADDFTEAGGELTPSLKIKRKLVTEQYRDVIDRLYEG